MGVVQLDCRLVGQGADILVELYVAAQDVLNGSGGEEILLPQSQFLPGLVRICGIQHAHQAGGTRFAFQRAYVIACVECIQLDRVQRVGRPQAQGVHPLAAPAHDRRIHGRGLDLFRRLPLNTIIIVDDFSAKTDTVSAFTAIEFPGVAMAQPGFGQFHLPAIVDPLTEHAVYVADAIAVGRNIQTGEAFHEAGGQAAKPAVAKGGIRIQLFQFGKFETMRAQRPFQRARQVKIVHCIAQQAADQEFQAKVIHALCTIGIGAARAFHPAVDHLVAKGIDGGGVPVVRLCRALILAHAVTQGVDNQGVDLVIVGARSGGGQATDPYPALHRRAWPDRTRLRLSNAALGRFSCAAQLAKRR